MFRVGVVLSICADTRIKIHAALPKISLTTLLWPAIHFYIFQWFVRSSSTDFSGLTIIKISRENGRVPTIQAVRTTLICSRKQELTPYRQTSQSKKMHDF